MTPADVIQKLSQTNSRLEKEAILKEAWDLKILELFELCQYALDPMVTFGVKRAPESTSINPPGAFGKVQFRALLELLAARKLSGHAARDAIQAAAAASNAHEWNNFYRRLILKDLKCGMSESTINKVLKAQGAPGKRLMVPEYSCQLAKDGADRVDELKGRWLCDRKLDGVRLNTFLDKETGTVIQRTRNGAQNDNFPQLTEALTKLLPHLSESLVLDGEIVSASFQELMKQLNRKKADTKDARLALFDVIPMKDFLKGEYRVSQRDRHLALCELEPMLRQATNDAVYVVPKIEIDFDTSEGRARMQEFNREALDAGYEGIMMKNPDAPYRTKRTEAWLKMKPWITVDLEIVEVVQGEPGKETANTMANIICRGEDNGRMIEVSVGSGFDDELRDRIWRERANMIGMIVEIKADAITQARDSETFSLRFPRFLTFRGTRPGEKI